jgi:hypothetical protein
MNRAIVLILCCVGCCIGVGLPVQDASAAIVFKRFPHCGDGLVTEKTCECHKAGTTRFYYCHKGYYCHTYDGTCRP